MDREQNMKYSKHNDAQEEEPNTLSEKLGEKCIEGVSTEENDVLKIQKPVDDATKESNAFKNPNDSKCPLIGKIPKLRNTVIKSQVESTLESNEAVVDNLHVQNDNKACKERPKEPPFPYVEPVWGGKPEGQYSMEVLKSGVIMDTISLNTRSYHVLGRSPSCDICLAHPTISRFHVVLQYRTTENRNNPKGLYAYDLGSTHGTFWNGNRIKPNVYVRVQGGHMLKFGCSQRKYILQAPPEDQEEESEYTVTELKNKRMLELEQRSSVEEVEKTAEEKETEGIDWGMGEDADETTDLEENPYASTADEELVLDDPKKTLRGWFEREGYDLQYQTEEKGVGQFLCWINLPMESIIGRSVRAEALVKGKKKESVVQCALEACRILDKYGLLRQANHEARKRKTRNWEEEDYYDSDEDNFLDRTGSIEKKREQRMRLAGKLEEKVETYDSLLKKHQEVMKRIVYLSNSIKDSQKRNNDKDESTDDDALDAFMSTLSSSTLTKGDVAKMKVELQNLCKEETGLIKLLNLTRPADLPPLIPQNALSTQMKTVKKKGKSETISCKEHNSAFLRARKRQMDQLPDTGSSMSIVKSIEEEEVESEDESVEKMNDDPVSVCSRVSNDKEIKNGEPSDQSSEKKTEEQQNKKLENFPTKRQKHEGSKKQRERTRKTCDQDVYAENYSTWVPPQDQAGDGKTSLNEKYGY